MPLTAATLVRRHPRRSIFDFDEASLSGSWLKPAQGHCTSSRVMWCIKRDELNDTERRRPLFGRDLGEVTRETPTVRCGIVSELSGMHHMQNGG